MKKRRILSILLVLQMLLTMSFAVAHADGETPTIASGYSISNWKGPYYDGGTPNGQAGGIAPSAGRNGGAALLLTFPAESHNHNIYFQNANNKTLTSGTTYVIGAWINMINKANGHGAIYIGVGWGRTIVNYDNKIKETDGDWARYEVEYTPTQDYTAAPWIFVDKGWGEDYKILIDGVYIKEKGTDTNLFDNPEFDPTFNAPTRTKISEGRQALRSSKGWQEYYTGSNETLYMQPVRGDDYTYEGEKAVYVSRKNSAYGLGERGIEYGFSDGSLTPGTYTFTIYLKGTVDNESQVFFGSRNHYDRLTNYEKTYVGDGWYRYTKTVNVNTNDSYQAKLYFGNYCKDASLYIDGLSIKDESGNEYMPNGGFEDCYVIDNGAPTHFVAYSASNTNKGKGVIAWRNPEKDNISNITLTVNGEEVEFEANSGSGAYNQVVIDVTDNEMYSVVLSITSDTTYTVEKDFIPNSASKVYAAAGNRGLSDGWCLTRQESAGEYTNTTLDIDYDIKASGDSSMRITCGRDGATSGVYAALTQTVKLQKNTAYRFTAKVRHLGIASGRARIDGIYNTASGWYNSDAGTKLQLSGERERWTTFTYDIDPTDSEADDDEKYSKNVMFIVDAKADAIWIDDVTIYKLVRGVEDTSVNYVKNGGFEYGNAFDFVGYEYYDTFEGEELDRINTLQEGTIKGYANYKNYTDSSKNVMLVAAVYEDGKLIDSSIAKATAPVQINPYTSNRIGTSVTVPEMQEGKSYGLKLYFWDGFDFMQPLHTPGELTE